MAITATKKMFNQVPEYAGKSTDQKPTEGIENGSTLLEMDTGKVYVFDAAASTWIEL